MNQASERVRQIVNQPVQRYATWPGLQVRTYSPGWFHPGAIKPAFDTVDVRASRELAYPDSEYVTSDLNPGVVFRGHDLEFNPMTKYFYTDRTVPKKRLTEAEMVEINSLYRVIGRCERELARLHPPDREIVESDESGEAGEVLVRQPIPRSRYIHAGLAIAGVLALYVIYRILRR